MKRKRVIIFFIFILILILPVQINAQKQNYINKLPANVAKRIYENRIIYKSYDDYFHEFLNYVYYFSQFEDEIPTELIKYKGENFLNIVSVKNAISDVEFLFKLLKFGYSAYQFFGGDKKFLEAKSNIIEEIRQERFFPLISVSRLNNIIYENLSFIQDGHFSIGHKDYIKFHYYYTNEEYDFYKDNNSYYTILDGERSYLISINGESAEKYMKLSLNFKGEIVYRIGQLLEEPVNNSIETNLSLRSRGEEINISLVLEEPDYDGVDFNNAYNSFKRKEITVIEQQTFHESTKNMDSLRKFVSDAYNLKNNKFLILDLRGNSGGSCKYPKQWIENYTGEKIDYLCGNYQLLTNTSIKMLLNTMKLNENDPEIISNFEIDLNELKRIHKNGWYLVYPGAKNIKINNLLIVLTDSYISSAGEFFISLLNQINNVIFIGSNTSGIYITGNNGTCKLPHSKLEVTFGTDLSLYPDFKFREGVGFSPDFWVNPANSLELAVKFIKNYF